MVLFARLPCPGRISKSVWGALGGVVLFLPACGGGSEQAALPTFSEGKPPLQAPPLHQVGGFSIQLPMQTLAPGEELNVCYLFPMDIQGASRIVGGGLLTTGPGMHHGNITSQKKTGDGMRPCPQDSGGIGGEAGDILEGGAVLFASSTQISGEEWQSFPEGMGFPIRDGYEIVARMHYLNASANPITVEPKYEWFTVGEATVDTLLGPFIWVFKGFQIPPNSELTVTGGCRMPEPMHLVNVLPHMHALGTAFTADFLGGPLDGKRFLNSTGYDPDNGVWTQYLPAIDLSQGVGARFSCTWNNTYEKTIVEGIGENEMCIMFGYAYPYNNAFSTYATGPEQCVTITPPPL